MPPPDGALSDFAVFYYKYAVPMGLRTLHRSKYYITVWDNAFSLIEFIANDSAKRRTSLKKTAFAHRFFCKTGYVTENPMNVNLENNCQIKYWRNPMKIVDSILQKIPEKYIVGLGKVIFFDESNNPVVKYTKGRKKDKLSTIEIYMGGFAKGKMYSVFHLNLLFLGMINEHIVRNLKPKSNDPDIKSVRPHRFNPKWMYLGWSSPILIPLKVFKIIYEKFGFCSNLV